MGMIQVLYSSCSGTIGWKQNLQSYLFSATWGKTVIP